MTGGCHFENEKSQFTIYISRKCRMKNTEIGHKTANINTKTTVYP